MTARTARDAKLLSLKTRIARLRRRLDRDVDRSLESALLKRDWRRYVEKHPARSLAMAAGVGALLTGLAPGRGPESGQRLAFQAIRAAWPQIWRELAQLVMRRGAGDNDRFDAGSDDEPISGEPT